MTIVLNGKGNIKKGTNIRNKLFFHSSFKLPYTRYNYPFTSAEPAAILNHRARWYTTEVFPMALHGTRTVCKLSRCTKLCLLDSRPRRFAECRPPCLMWHEPDILSLIVLYFMHYPLCKPYLEIMRDHGGPQVECGKRSTGFPISSREHRERWTHLSNANCPR